MKLSKLYSNKPTVFTPVEFNPGLNVILAEIRLLANRDKDTHNLGKSIFGRMIDFCLLLGKDARFFLFKHEKRFESFIFFLEIQLLDGSFVTVRRSVQEATKIAFKRHERQYLDLNDLQETEWDHVAIPFDRAKEMLDGMLDLRAIRPWNFRKCLGYFLRSQDDYTDIFQLGSYNAKHAYWKPCLAHMLGFNSKLLVDHYDAEDQLDEKQQEESTIKKELGGSIEDISKVEGLLLLKQNEAEKKEKLLQSFDFRTNDKDKTKQIVDHIDETIADLNGERYSLMRNRKRIVASLEEQKILFDPEEAKKLFDEAGIQFSGQLKKDFEQLIKFNRAITEERSKYLEEERAEIDARLKVINAELSSLGRQRSDTLSYLQDTDIFAKFKEYSEDLVTLKADIASLERQKEFLQKLQKLRTDIRDLVEKRNKLQSKIEADVEENNAKNTSLFSNIRVFFNEIVEAVISRKALLSVSPNKEGHLEFKAEILDESGNATSADHGHTYRKLLCIALDLAVLRAHIDVEFPRFVFHDGVFESLDDRKKVNLVTVIRDYAGLGLQPIITLIDSDLPLRTEDEEYVFDEDEIVLLLHDEGEDGRLFKMESW